MASNSKTVLNAKELKLYLFSSALAINLFLEIIIIANGLSIQYFLYTNPMIIGIDFLSTIWNTLLLVGSLYFVYITKEVVEETLGFRRVHRFLNVAIVGSFFLLFSVFLAAMSPAAKPEIKLFLNQLGSVTVPVGYALSFAGSSLALLMILSRKKDLLRLFQIYLFSLLIPIEIWSLIHWVAYPFDVTSYIGFAWRGAFIELQLFYLSYPLILWLFIVFLFSWIWVPLVKCAKERIRLKQGIRIKAFLFGSQSDTKPLNAVTHESLSDCKDDTSRAPSTSRLFPIAIMFVSLFLGVFIAHYPYINPKPGLVGWDTLGYYLSLNGMVDKDFYGAVQFAATTNRPLYFLLLYFFRSLTQLPTSAVIEFMPVATILVNALAVFWFVKIGEKRALVAFMAVVFSMCSFDTTVAMHSGILANWFAMALGFTVFGLVLKLQRKKSWKLLFAVTVAFASVFFIHYWSGIFFLLVLGFYLVLLLLERIGGSTKLAVAMVVLASSILIALFSSGLTSHFFASYGYAENTGPTEAFVLFLEKLPIAIDSWFFGALANPVMLALALIGIVVCFFKKTNFRRILISWTVVGSLISVFVSPIGRNMNQWLMWRPLYLIPFQIPAALGLFFLVSKLGSLGQGKRGVKWNDEDFQHAKSSPNFSENENLKVAFYLTVHYLISALLLTLDLPILGALVFFNYSVLTLIVHFKIRKMGNNSVLVFIFVVFVTLLLFNYALRSLAPLAVHRMQP